MDTIARAFPITSRDALVQMGKQIDEFSSEHKKILKTDFGLDREKWFYQEIEGNPYVIAVVRGESLEDGFKKWANTEDEFAVWFRRQVLEITGIDLTVEPKGPQSDLIYELRP